MVGEQGRGRWWGNRGGGDGGGKRGGGGGGGTGEGEMVGERGEGEVVTTPLIILVTVGKTAVDEVGVKHCMSNLQDKYPLQYMVHIVQYCKLILLPCYLNHLHSN